jgi:RNA polymerase sigma-70 factor (ECF subfamily)
MKRSTEIDCLIEKIVQEDDHGAYKQLYELYYHRLFQFAYSITRSKESAEEIVSDVFIKIWLKRKTLAEISNKHLYLYISIKNQSFNYLAKNRKNETFSLDECVVEIQSIYFDPEQLLITEEMLKRIHSAINQLPPKCQLIFKLIKEDGLRYKEVAELLGLSIKTIENQMAVALRKLEHSIGFDIVRSVSS